MNVVGVHQPNFLPWLGFFHKALQSDVLVLLDDAQFAKGSVINRVKLLISGEARWITCPVLASGGHSSLISEMELEQSLKWREKNLRAIQVNYGRHPYFEEVIEVVGPLLVSSETKLVNYNASLIESVSEGLGLDSDLFRFASSQAVTSQATQRLVDLVESFEGDVYLAGGGAGGYQEDALFQQHGIFVKYQAFRTRPYPQKGASEFVPGLSILDCLFNLGWSDTMEIIDESEG